LGAGFTGAKLSRATDVPLVREILTMKYQGLPNNHGGYKDLWPGSQSAMCIAKYEFPRIQEHIATHAGDGPVGINCVSSGPRSFMT